MKLPINKQLTNLDENYNFIEILGRGSYGIIFKVIDKKNKRIYALKLSPFDENFIIDPQIFNEMVILSKIKHKNIILLEDAFFGVKNNRIYFCMKLELCAKNIIDFSKINNNKCGNQTSSLTKIIYHVLDALNILNQYGYYHGDLSFQNIMTKSKDVKIIDFGLTKKYYRNFDIELLPTITVRPTEFFQKKVEINQKSIDSWAVGRLIKTLFSNINFADQKKKKREQFDPENILQNLEKLLDKNPHSRMSLDKLIQQIEKKNIFHFTRVFPFFGERRVNSKLSNRLLLKIVDILSNIIFLNNLEEELIFNTIHNLKSLISLRIVKIKNTKEMVMYALILFWIGNKIISTSYINLSILQFLIRDITHINIDSSEIAEIHNDICSSLQWVLDPETAISYTDFIPNKFRNHFRYLNLLILFHKELDGCLEFSKASVAYKIIQEYFDLMENKFNDLMQQFIENNKDLNSQHQDILKYRIEKDEQKIIYELSKTLDPKHLNLEKDYNRNIKRYFSNYSKKFDKLDLQKWIESDLFKIVIRNINNRK